jgi:CubicO group peptidase (beta-lactamase class C family)
MSTSRTLTSNQAVIGIALIIIVAGGGYWWYSSSLQPEPDPSPSSDNNVTYTRFSRFGFSLEHPSGMVFTPGVLLGGFDHVHLVNGDVQGASESGSNLVGVIWIPTEFVPSLEDALDDLVESAGENLESFKIGDKFTTTKNDSKVFSQWFNFIEQGSKLTGVTGIWESKLDDKIYVLYQISPLTQDVIEIEFQRYLDSFSIVGTNTSIGYDGFYYPTEGWRFAKPEEMGLDSMKLNEMIMAVNEQGIGADSILVARDGYVVLDAYFPPFDEGENHIIYSCTKSVVSTLIGMALEEGYIESLDIKLIDIFANRNVQNLSPWKEEITLRDLLTMTAGLDARDSYLYDWEGLDKMHNANDWVEYVLNLPMMEEPGTRFEYTNGVSHLLSGIITETTGINSVEFAQEHLFGPLGITNIGWNLDPKGINWGYSGLYLTPHDMAKIGYLFLNKGEWDGEQIISKEWIEEATQEQVEANTLLPGYGFQWWVSPEGYYSAIGYKGQFIHIVPEYKLIMVTTSRNADDFYRIQQLLTNYVIPAIIEQT